jgi:hypothetical protein
MAYKGPDQFSVAYFYDHLGVLPYDVGAFMQINLLLLKGAFMRVNLLLLNVQRWDTGSKWKTQQSKFLTFET